MIIPYEVIRIFPRVITDEYPFASRIIWFAWVLFIDEDGETDLEVFETIDLEPFRRKVTSRGRFSVKRLD